MRSRGLVLRSWSLALVGIATIGFLVLTFFAVYPKWELIWTEEHLWYRGSQLIQRDPPKETKVVQRHLLFGVPTLPHPPIEEHEGDPRIVIIRRDPQFRVQTGQLIIEVAVVGGLFGVTILLVRLAQGSFERGSKPERDPAGDKEVGSK